MYQNCAYCVGRAWPIFVGSGFGLGYAMSNCQHDFKRVNSLHLQPIRVRGSVNEVCDWYLEPFVTLNI